MLELLGLKAVNFMTANPFVAAKPLVQKYGGDAGIFAYAVALFFLVLVGIGLMAGSARTRQGLKSHLGWILLGVCIVAGAGYLVRWVHQDSTNTFGTIMPIHLLTQFDAFKALL